MTSRDYVRSPRTWAVVMLSTAALIVLAPRRADASCIPCGNFACVNPQGGCLGENMTVCIGGGGSGPGALLFCEPAGVAGSCPTLVYWGQC
jgi:hypothetical protein